jgi:hypothetical protein
VIILFRKIAVLHPCERGVFVEEESMNSEQIENLGAKPFEVNVEAPEKPAESFVVEQTQTAVKAGETQEAVQKQSDEKLDLWMKNIKEFIRNIDVKSL